MPGVPDLLFEDVCGARVEELRPYLGAPERLGAGVPLHRVTVFLTYRCNLACPYCKTIARSAQELVEKPQKAVTYSVERFDALLERIADMPLAHVHFTGGEAALVPGVEEMVRHAKARGVPHVSMTSNGTAPVKRYLALVEAGLNELRVSIDAHEAALGARLTGRANAWSKSVETLRALSSAKVHRVANVVVGRENRRALGDIVRFLLSLGPDDIKLITEVDAREDFEAREDVQRELNALVASLPADGSPLLRRKVKTVFAPDAIGLGPRAPGWKCWVPATERTVDAVSYYPCSVYLREGGAPIGSVEEDAETQRRKTARWMRTHDCAKDAICQRYCLMCTRRYNDAMNASPVLVLTPLGLSTPDTAETLRAHGLSPTQTLELPDYGKTSRAFYGDDTEGWRSRFEGAWHALCGPAPGEAWVLSREQYGLALKLKPKLRELWRPATVSVGGRVLRLNRFHLPDPAAVAETWRSVTAAGQG